MKVSIIIVTYNAECYIEDCLRSLFETVRDIADMEVIVVENHSSDATRRIVEQKFPQVKIFALEENLGFAGGNNVGMRYAMENGAEYVYLLNQDTECSSGWMYEALGAMERDPKIASVQSLLLLHPEKIFVNSRGNNIHFLGFGYAGGYKCSTEDAREMDGKEIAYASGAAVLLRVSALKDVGLFNPSFFMYHEDLDLGWRFLLRGWKNVLAEKSVVYHKYEFSRSIRKYYYMERNRFWTLIQNYKIGTLILLAPAFFIVNIGLLFSSFFSGWWREELWAWMFYFRFSTWKELLRSRKEIQSKRIVKDREMVRHFVSTIDFQEISNPMVRYILNPVLTLYWKIVKKIILW